MLARVTAIFGRASKVLKSSDFSFATLAFESVKTLPPRATSPADASTRFQYIEFDVPPAWVGELLQFGFCNDLTPSLGQSWTTSAALYDNVTLTESVSGTAVLVLLMLGLGLAGFRRFV